MRTLETRRGKNYGEYNREKQEQGNSADFLVWQMKEKNWRILGYEW